VDALLGRGTVVAEQVRSEQSNTQQARKLAEEVVRREDTTVIEVLLADAIGHLADEIDALREQHDRSLRAAFDAIGP
jgi:acyl CoA:acetate/3-ketoacid CoA transferase alpha subunit